ncbi:hypothetical protein BGW39_010593 [Mortierella sp. 14UC]|nr:hypothetical protein BGW39_010593 [Mortierella sp. 14UC]
MEITSDTDQDAMVPEVDTKILDPIELKFSPSVTPSTPPPETLVDENVRAGSKPSRSLAPSRQVSFADRSFSPPAFSRAATDPTDRFAASSSPPWADFSGPLSSSQDPDQMNWSPKKPASSPPTRLPAVNISFGEMLGFPSAKFQQPENHFAHRSVPDSGRSEPWAFRKPTDTSSSTFGGDRAHRHGQSSRPSGLSRNTDVDMDGDDDDDDYNDNDVRTGSFVRSRRGTGLDSDFFGNSFSALGRPSQARDSWTVDGREAFAAQTYFPPEPETGLEDNFFGVVKIVDDYLPPKQEPRTIDARNLMLKKRMARRWLVFVVLCRALTLLKPDGMWVDKLLWTSHHVFAVVLLHATAFWVLDESRAFQRYLNRKPATTTDKKTAAARPKDPFEPTPLDKICSYILMVLLSMRVLSLTWAVVSKPSHSADTNDTCNHIIDLSSPGNGLGSCQVSLDDRYSDLDWPIEAVQLAMPWAKEGGYDLRTLASYAGWIHDMAIVALLGVLMACGAGTSSSSTIDRAKAPEGGKDLRRKLP